MAAVANGSRSIDRAWHQLRAARPPLETWQAFAHVCRSRGRKYDNRWAKHQWLCWTELSDAGTYPRQREEWAAKQAAFVQAMDAKSGRVRTNAQIRADRQPQPDPNRVQLSLF